MRSFFLLLAMFELAMDEMRILRLLMIKGMEIWEPLNVAGIALYRNIVSFNKVGQFTSMSGINFLRKLNLIFQGSFRSLVKLKTSLTNIVRNITFKERLFDIFFGVIMRIAIE
jgi:hypothetical protein